jgi:hypothetical protein
MRDDDVDELGSYFQILSLGDESPAYMNDPEPPATLVRRWTGGPKRSDDPSDREPLWTPEN